MSVGTRHSLAVRSDGTAWAWGSNRQGQLGDGTDHTQRTPAQMEGLSGVEALAGTP
ncbi:Regulator of chromosome condensation (RCC1) repeat-containing protein [Stigmatella aurantiaca]|uniref:Regulator of chromosome condensation (RCC1) repeat-containing protein n=1 Tax=Stigmatella aurantiaca TaxID=41 RepID=A0A1H8E9U2_STIAU|nr:Regulator of chromosome condensation (RCC1) repeat-containing protein [Stigmatella aurantiaca]